MADAAEREVFEYIVGSYVSPETCARHPECVNHPNFGPICAAQNPVRYRAHLYISKRFREREDLARQVVELLHMWGAFLEEQFVPTELEVYAEEHLSHHGFGDHGGPTRTTLRGGNIQAVRPGERGETTVTIPPHASLGPSLRDCVHVDPRAILTRVTFRDQAGRDVDLWSLSPDEGFAVIVEALNPTDRAMDIGVAVFTSSRCTKSLIDRTEALATALKAAGVRSLDERQREADARGGVDGSTRRPP